MNLCHYETIKQAIFKIYVKLEGQNTELRIHLISVNYLLFSPGS